MYDAGIRGGWWNREDAIDKLGHSSLLSNISICLAIAKGEIFKRYLIINKILHILKLTAQM